MTAIATHAERFVPVRASLNVLLAAIILSGCSALFGGGGGMSREEAAARGFELFEQGSYSHAMGVFNDLLDEDPNNAVARYGLGRVFTETGYIDGAAEQFRMAVALDSSYGEAYLGLGRLNYELGYYDRAEKQILEAQRHGAGETAQALYLLGLFAIERGSYWEAETSFRRSLKAEPVNSEVRLALVDLLRKRSRYEDALAELEKADFSRGSEDDLKLRFADCRLHLGQDLEAERLYREIVSRDRHNAEPRWGLALLALRRGDHEEAADQLDRYALLLSPDEGRIFQELAAALTSPDARFAFLDRCREALNVGPPAISDRLRDLIEAVEGSAE